MQYGVKDILEGMIETDRTILQIMLQKQFSGV
jgi:hypothetical protein